MKTKSFYIRILLMLLIACTSCEDLFSTEDDTNNPPTAPDCSDCAKNQKVVYYKQRATSIPECMSCSYCAAAYTAQCFLNGGCYQEAGAKTAVTRAQLQKIISANKASAAALGNSCP